MGDYITVAELQATLHVSRATAYRVAQAIPHVRVGRSIRVSRAGLERYLRLHDYTIPTRRDEHWS